MKPLNRRSAITSLIIDIDATSYWYAASFRRAIISLYDAVGMQNNDIRFYLRNELRDRLLNEKIIQSTHPRNRTTK